MKRVILLLLAGIIFTQNFSSAQMYMNHDGIEKPIVVVGAETIFRSKDYQVFPELSVNLLLPFTDLELYHSFTAQTVILNFGVDSRKNLEKGEKTIWRIRLLDFNGANNDNEKYNWLYNKCLGRGTFRPSDIGIVIPKSKVFCEAGATLLDYDRASISDLDARWFQLRYGYGYAQNLYDEEVYLEPKLTAALGSTSINLGKENFSSLSEDVDKTFFGAEGNLNASLRFRYQTNFFLTADAQSRNIFSSEVINFLSYGATANLILNTGDKECNNSGFEVFVRFEQNKIFFQANSQQYWQFMAGVQYAFLNLR